MFSNLRPNSQLYILHKDTTPYIEIGQVVSVSQPIPRYQTNNFMTPQELVVDVVVNVNGNNITLQKLPANLDVADQGSINGSLFISTSKESMNNEVTSLKQKSQEIINSIDYHKKVIQDCEVLLQRLNPEFAEQKQQKQEIDNLKAQVSEMMNGMKELMAQLKKETPKS
nr:MAG TPA: hypothetical protein [Crassvirales sp.]